MRSGTHQRRSAVHAGGQAAGAAAFGEAVDHAPRQRHIPSMCLQVEPPAPLPPGEATIYAEATLPPARSPPDPGASVPEDPDAEFGYTRGEVPRVDGPRVINVGVPGPGVKANMWRRAWRDKARVRQHCIV
jgi:hypothetical protein